MKTYTAEIERDEDGIWCGIVHLGKKETAVSDGPTLERARKRLREAVAILTETDESDVFIELDVKLPAHVKRSLGTLERRKRALEKAQNESRQAVQATAKALEAEGLSRRDIGELLGVTRARASQLLQG